MTLRRVGAFIFAAIASFALTANGYSETSHPVRLSMVLLAVILLHLLKYGRFRVYRELLQYGAFVGYMCLSLLWTDDVDLALQTLLLTVNFVLVLVLFSILVFYYDIGGVFGGALVGFLVGAVVYTLTAGFPFRYPDQFSYNSIAGMYLYGLIITVLFGWHSRYTLFSISVGLILMLHIAATTSIKTNLGILIGVCAAAILYFRSFLKVLRRIAIPLVVFVIVIAYAVMSSDALMQRVQTGFNRVSAGARVLVAREDTAGVTEFGARVSWKNEGLRGWLLNPVFGNGVEAFRDDYGITSHSTPIDLLYNSGLIGFLLFYGALLSVAWRMFRARNAGLRDLLALLAAGLVCYLFISLSGTMYYDSYLAAFIGICVALIGRLSDGVTGAEQARR